MNNENLIHLGRQVVELINIKNYVTSSLSRQNSDYVENYRVIIEGEIKLVLKEIETELINRH